MGTTTSMCSIYMFTKKVLAIAGFCSNPAVMYTTMRIERFMLQMWRICLMHMII